MSKLSSSGFSVILVDGYDVRAAAIQGWNAGITSPQAVTHGLGDAWKTQAPIGVQEASLSQQGAFFDDTTNGIHDAFKAAGTAQRIVCWCYNGNTIAKAFAGCEGVFQVDYEVLGKVGDLTKANVTYGVTGRLDRGSVICNQAARTANFDTSASPVDFTTDTSQRTIPISGTTKANPCVITTPVAHGLTSGQVILIAGNSLSTPAINGQQTVTVLSTTTFSVPVNTTASTGTGNDGTFVLASTVNGGAGYQAVSAFSGFTGYVGKIRSSPDNVTYADLVTFTNVTAGPVAERIAVAGTVARYLLYTGTVTGSGSVTPFAGFSRYSS